MSIFTKTKKQEQVKEADSGNIKKDKNGGSKINTNQAVALNIKQPWITEKAGRLAELRKYIFLINSQANKSEVAKMIENIYGVKVAAVNMVNLKAKTKRLGRNIGKISGRKKAIVTLKEGYKIDIIPA